MTKIARQRFAAWLRDESGQAMTEYAATTTVLLAGGVAAPLAWPFFSMMIEALNTHLSSVLFILNTPFP